MTVGSWSSLIVAVVILGILLVAGEERIDRPGRISRAYATTERERKASTRLVREATVYNALSAIGLGLLSAVPTGFTGSFVAALISGALPELGYAYYVFRKHRKRG